MSAVSTFLKPSAPPFEVNARLATTAVVDPVSMREAIYEDDPRSRDFDFGTEPNGLLRFSRRRFLPKVLSGGRSDSTTDQVFVEASTPLKPSNDWIVGSTEAFASAIVDALVTSAVTQAQAVVAQVEVTSAVTQAQAVVAQAEVTSAVAQAQAVVAQAQITSAIAQAQAVVAQAQVTFDADLDAALRRLSSVQAEADEDGEQVPSDAVIAKAKEALLRIHPVAQRTYDIYGLPNGEVVIEVETPFGASFVLIIEAGTGAHCLMAIGSSKVEQRKYADEEMKELPDAFMKDALDRLPKL